MCQREHRGRLAGSRSGGRFVKMDHAAGTGWLVRASTEDEMVVPGVASLEPRWWANPEGAWPGRDRAFLEGSRARGRCSRRQGSSGGSPSSSVGGGDAPQTGPGEVRVVPRRSRRPQPPQACRLCCPRGSSPVCVAPFRTGPSCYLVRVPAVRSSGRLHVAVVWSVCPSRASIEFWSRVTTSPPSCLRDGLRAVGR